MLTNTDLLRFNFIEHPFLRFPDTRLFYPFIKEQRKVFDSAWNFINKTSDPSKNLGVVTGPSGGGKSLLSMVLSNSIHPSLSQSVGYSIYINTNTVTEPRHFLMAILDKLNLSPSRSNENRLDSIFNFLYNSEKGLLMVLDGPPIDHEYIEEMLSWSVQNNKKIRAMIFLQELFEIATNLGPINNFLGLYHPFGQASISEIASLLISRCKMAGHPDPLSFLSKDEILKIAETSNGSIAHALSNACNYFETLVSSKLNDHSFLDV